MDKQQPIHLKDFFKQFKNKDGFHSFFNQLFKQGVEEMLRGELDEHLGYQKHSPEGRNKGNSRTSSYKRP
jgi:putative transposase